MHKLRSLFSAVKYIVIAAADKVMEFENSWENPWDSQKKEK